MRQVPPDGGGGLRGHLLDRGCGAHGGVSQVAYSIKGWTIKISVSDCSLISIAENLVTLLIILKTEPHVFRSEFFLIQRHKTVGQGASWSQISEIKTKSNYKISRLHNGCG